MDNGTVYSRKIDLEEICLDSMENISPNKDSLWSAASNGSWIAGCRVSILWQEKPKNEFQRQSSCSPNWMAEFFPRILHFFSFFFQDSSSLYHSKFYPQFQTILPLAPSSKLLNCHGKRTQFIFGPINAMDNGESTSQEEVCSLNVEVNNLSGTMCIKFFCILIF